jgi:predicted dinucleotide-binding enzyme
MRIAVIGAGRVGSTLGTRWSSAGHDVLYGVRTPEDPKYEGLEVETVGDAIEGADVVLLAVPWRAAREAIAEIGDVGTRIIIDATNPLTPDNREHDRHPELSGAELIAGWLEGGRVVKAFNNTGSANMANPDYPDGTPVMFIAGDDKEAKRVVLGLAAELGFDAVDAGTLAAARDLEHLATIWIRLAYGLGHGPDIAFSLLRR